VADESTAEAVAEPLSADEFNDFLASEVARYHKIVRDMGLKVD